MPSDALAVVNKALKQQKKEKYRGDVDKVIARAGMPAPVLEYQFHPTRKWRFDIAWPQFKVAIEIDGVLYGGGGRHQRVKGYEGDCLKLNEATRLGWRVYRWTWKQFRNIDHARYLGEFMPRGAVKPADDRAEAFNCPHCGDALTKMKTEYAGKILYCNKCERATTPSLFQSD